MLMAIVAMLSSKKKAAAQQSPPPGSYPDSSPITMAPSVVSTSVEVKDEITSILEEADFTACSFKGASSFVIPQERWAIVEAKLKSLAGQDKTTVSTAELAELQRELSLLRLRANDFQSQTDRFEYANTELEKALVIAKSQVQIVTEQSSEEKDRLNRSLVAIKSDLSSAQAIKKEYENALKVAKANANVNDIDKLTDDKRRMSAEITALNNNLQSVNGDIDAHSKKVARFEKQVLELTNELNLERSKHAIFVGRQGDTFADKASQLPGKAMNLVNLAYRNLPQVAKNRLDKVKDDPLADEKNTVFWLKATFDSTKHAVYRPYKRVFGGLLRDIQSLNASSRKKFDPFILAVRDSLLPTGQPLTDEEMDTMLSSMPINELKLNKAYRAKGYNSLQDLLSAGLDTTGPEATGIPYKVVDGKVVFKKPQPPSPTLSEKDVDEMDPLNDKDSSEDEDSTSYWVNMRNWLLAKFDTLNIRVRDSLRKSPVRLRRYYKLSKGNLIQRCLLVPYNWFIWAFP